MYKVSTSTRKLSLVTGPTRSGKSEWAEMLAARSGKAVIYIATAQTDPDDQEWQQRIIQHQHRRPANWATLHIPMALSATILEGRPTECLLVDSLGTWLANVLEQDEDQWTQTLQKLLTSLEQTASDVILVAEETGWGVVPAYPIGRRFRDRLGQLVRQVGAIASSVDLVTGGHVLNLSKLGMPIPASLSDDLSSKA
jgi:adenosylcobinamide kinase / adenosylcobinamide-phosphate guanylyltransferase